MKNSPGDLDKSASPSSDTPSLDASDHKMLFIASQLIRKVGDALTKVVAYYASNQPGRSPFTARQCMRLEAMDRALQARTQGDSRMVKDIALEYEQYLWGTEDTPTVQTEQVQTN